MPLRLLLRRPSLSPRAVRSRVSVPVACFTPSSERRMKPLKKRSRPRQRSPSPRMPSRKKARKRRLLSPLRVKLLLPLKVCYLNAIVTWKLIALKLLPRRPSQRSPKKLSLRRTRLRTRAKRRRSLHPSLSVLLFSASSTKRSLRRRSRSKMPPLSPALLLSSMSLLLPSPLLPRKSPLQLVLLRLSLLTTRRRTLHCHRRLAASPTSS